MKRGSLIALVLALTTLVVASCTASPPAPPDYWPTTPLDGWVKIARSNGAGASMSPSTRYLAYLTDQTFPPDVDPLPNDQNLYLLDRFTGTHYLVSPGLGPDAPAPYTTWTVNDDGEVLMRTPDVDPSFSDYSLFTIGGGVVPLSIPANVAKCVPQFETSGTGFKTLCNGTGPEGLYHFEAGDVTATPVAVLPDPPPDGRLVVNISPNHRYFLLKDPPTDCNIILNNCPPDNRWVYDSQTNTTAPFPYSDTPLGSLQFLSVNVRSTGTEGPDYLGDDGRIRYHNEGFGLPDLEAEQELWFNPNTGRSTALDGFPPMWTFGDAQGTKYFIYDDYTREIGHNYRLEGRSPSVLTVLGDYTSPHSRWVPTLNIGIGTPTPNGDIVGFGHDITTQPGDVHPGEDIYVRSGPLPPSP
jgi:hypothetical protein